MRTEKLKNFNLEAVTSTYYSQQYSILQSCAHTHQPNNLYKHLDKQKYGHVFEQTIIRHSVL